MRTRSREHCVEFIVCGDETSGTMVLYSGGPQAVLRKILTKMCQGKMESGLHTVSKKHAQYIMEVGIDSSIPTNLSLADRVNELRDISLFLSYLSRMGWRPDPTRK